MLGKDQPCFAQEPSNAGWYLPTLRSCGLLATEHIFVEGTRKFSSFHEQNAANKAWALTKANIGSVTIVEQLTLLVSTDA